MSDISDADFRHAMRAFATGVAIVACGRGEARAGCVATAVASLSLAPPSLIVNLQRDGSTYRRLRDAQWFSVNFLSAAQEPLARRFAGGALAGDRFAEGAWIEGATGAPVSPSIQAPSANRSAASAPPAKRRASGSCAALRKLTEKR